MLHCASIPIGLSRKIQVNAGKASFEGVFTTVCALLIINTRSLEIINGGYTQALQQAEYKNTGKAQDT